MNKKLHFKAKSLGFALVLALFLLSPLFAEANIVKENTISFLQQVKNGKVTLKVKDATLKAILYEIQKQTKINFIYDDATIKDFPKKSMQFIGISIEQALNQIFANSNLTYTIRENNITIVKKTVAKPISQAGKFTLNGKVIDKYKKPVTGATIVIKDTRKGAISNEDGQFIIKDVLPGENVVVTYVGMKDITKIAVATSNEVVYTLEEDLMNMDEVVITGMFNKPKESYTGAVTFISKKELTDFKSRNLLKTIANIDPAFNIVENNKAGSNPNVLPEINIRGMTNMPQAVDTRFIGNVEDFQAEQRTSLNTPLFILDGFEITLERMMDLDEEEIENVTILKDASSTAIYGSRGSNGVVVITSVKPVAGKLTVSVRASMNLEVPDLSSYNVLNAKEKLELEVLSGFYIPKNYDKVGYIAAKDALAREYEDKLGSIARGVDTYWLSQPLRTGMTGTYSLSLSGGDRSFRYSLSGSYSGNQGIMKGSDRNNFNGTLTISYLYKTLQFSNSVSLGVNSNHDSMYGSYGEYAKLNPYYTPYDDDGNLVMHFNISQAGNMEASKANNVLNPMYDATTTSYKKANYTNIRNNTSMEYSPFKSLKIGARIGFAQNMGENHDYKASTHSSFFKKAGDPKETDITDKGSYAYGTNKSISYDMSLNISYAKVFGKHSVYAGVNADLRESNSVSYSIKAKGYTHERFDFLSMGSKYDGEKPGGSEATSRSVGLTGSLNYNFDRTLFVDASYRMDGASSFGSYSRFKPFYSVGAGWTVSGMKFMRDNVQFINTLRFKYNYGVTGSLPFSVYDALTTFQYNETLRYEGLMGATIFGIGNPNLTWQYTYSHNLGMELDLLKSKVSLSGNIYDRQTKGSITSAKLPLSNGYTKYVENQGDIQNRGFDAGVSVRILNNSKRQITWSARLNFAANWNKMVRLSEAMKAYSAELDRRMVGKDQAPPLLYREGESMDALYCVPSLGIDPASGEELFLKRDGTVTFDYPQFDKVALGIKQPKFNGSLTTSFRYRRLSVSLGFAIKLGGQTYNSTLSSKVDLADPKQNVDRRVYDERWRGVDQYTKYRGLQAKQKTGQSSRFMQDESTLKCNSLNVNYSFSSKWLKRNMGLSGINLGVSSNELFQISTVKLERGLSYPFSRRVSINASLTF